MVSRSTGNFNIITVGPHEDERCVRWKPQALSQSAWAARKSSSSRLGGLFRLPRWAHHDCAGIWSSAQTGLRQQERCLPIAGTARRGSDDAALYYTRCALTAFSQEHAGYMGVIIPS